MSAKKHKPVPTSPKVKAEKELEKLYSSDDDFVKPQKRGVDWIASIIIGLLGGVVGGGLLLIFADDLGLSSYLPSVTSEREVIVRETDEATSEKLQMEEALEVSQASLVSIYPKELETGSELSQVLTPFDYKGSAIVMTSDDWLVTTTEVIAFPEIDYVAEFSDGSIHDIVELVTDTADGLVFARVDASDLSVATFAGRGDVEVGDPVFVVNRPPTSTSNRIEGLTVADWSYRSIETDNDVIQFSDTLNRRTRLSATFEAGDEKLVAILPNGRVLGFVEQEGTALAVHVPYRIESVLRQVVDVQSVTRPSLNMLYYDLSEIVGLPEDVTQGQKAGAVLLFGPESLGGTAATAGLRDRDIVLSVDGDVITERVSLSEALLKHESGETLSFVVLRDGTEKTVEVTLD